MKNVTIKIREETKHKLKILAANRRETIIDTVRALVEEALVIINEYEGRSHGGSDKRVG